MAGKLVFDVFRNAKRQMLQKIRGESEISEIKEEVIHLFNSPYEVVLYICDDEEQCLIKIKKICEKIFDKIYSGITIVTGKNGKEVLTYPGEIDILILDIDMPGIDGIQVKKQLQQKNRNTNIIFVTNHLERMKEAFGLWVFGFVDKDTMEDELNILLPELINRVCRYVKINGVFDSREVLYLKADGSYTRLYFRKGKQQTIRKTLKELEEELERAEFVRTHRSYLVNMNEITGRITDTVMVGENRIPVSIRLRKKVKETYQIFCREHMGY